MKFKIFIVLTLLFTLTSCSVTTIKAKKEPSKESSEVLVEYASLANILEYEKGRKLLEEKYEIIKDYDLVMQSYGFLEYYIYENYDKAEALYKKAINLNPDNPDHYSGLASTYEAKGDYKQAVKYYNKAIKKINNYEDVPLNPQLAIAYKDIGRCYIKLNEKNKAIKALEKSSKYNPYSIDTNAMLHLLYVEKEEYNKAYVIWKNDNYIQENGDCIYESIKELNNLYKNELADNSSHYNKAKLYDSLALYDEAAIEYEKALSENINNEVIANRLNEIKTYILFREKLQRLLDYYYRQRCIAGVSAEHEFYNIIKPAYEIISKLYPKIDIKHNVSVLWFNKLNDELQRNFKIRIQDIKANGRLLGLHFGRILDSSTIHYSMWGKDIDLSIITLKNMYSNGVDDWRSRGNGGVGGWSLSSSEIVRVIKNNEIDNVLKLASTYNEGANKNFYESQGFNLVLEDVDRDPLEIYFTPNILKDLVEKQIEIEVEASKLQGISDIDLQRYIFDRYDKDFTIKTCIYVHESQHSMDSKYGIPFSWFGENEYRPKMSQLVYGHMPFMSLSQYYVTSLGENVQDTHSMANTRVFNDIINYIYNNSNEFPEIDINKNILSQLVNLSENDIKNIAINIFEKQYPKEKFE